MSRVSKKRGYSAKGVLYRLASTDSPGMSRVSKKRGYSAKGVLYRLASTDSPGMSKVSGESVDTLSRGYYIGWHPRIVRGCPEYPGNPWILCQGCII